VYILGIHDGHCSSACLLSDERIVAWVQEERFTRKKNEIDFPKNSIEYCLGVAGIKGKDLDMVAIATNDFDPNIYRIKRETSFSIEDWLREQKEYWYPLYYQNKTNNNFYIDLSKEVKFKDIKTHYPVEEIDVKLPLKDRVNDFRKLRVKHASSFLGIDSTKVFTIDHHNSHAKYAYYASSLRKKTVAVLTNDGGGDATNASVWIKKPGSPLKLIARNNCSNTGRVYRYITALLGMKIGEHEFKVMGLAPYATDREVEKSWNVFKNLFKIENNLIVPNEKIKDLFFHFRDALLGHRFDGIAGAVQRMVEKTNQSWFASVAKKLKTSHFVYSGGVAMNVKLNGVLASEPYIDSLHVPPSGGDESLSLGAAYVLLEEFFVHQSRDVDTMPSIKSIYLGPEITLKDESNACKKALEIGGFSIIANVTPEAIAGYLADGKIIARCSGRMEFGQRSLGNRSIFADPRSTEVVEQINTKIKYRDFWMPFAPMVLDEDIENYFFIPAYTDMRYMMSGLCATPLGYNSIPGGLHQGDKTGRPQLMSEDLNPEVYAMLKEFKKITGIGGVINTSFNIHGNPIVCTACDALETMQNCDLDGVWVNNKLIYRNSAFSSNF
jgi:carbamoyltransferase